MAGLITPSDTLADLDRCYLHLAIDDLTIAQLTVCQMRRQVVAPAEVVAALAALDATLQELGMAVLALRGESTSCPVQEA